MSFDQLWSRLDEHGRERGSEPWLFFPRRFAWRWLSWQEGGLATRALGEGLEAAREERGGEARALLADRAEAAVLLAWLAASRRQLPLGWRVEASAPAPARTLTWRRGPREDDLTLDLWWRGEATEAAPVLAVAPCDLQIASRGRREIAFFWGHPSAPGAERFVGWALAHGAALAVEPHGPAALASAAWVRPTILWLGAGPSLIEGLLAATGRLRRGLLSRLEVIVASEVDPSHREQLAARGIELRLLAESDPLQDSAP